MVSYTLLGLVMRYRIQSSSQVGRELTEINSFEVVEILIFEDMGLVRFGVVLYTLLGLVLRGRIQSLS